MKYTVSNVNIADRGAQFKNNLLDIAGRCGQIFQKTFRESAVKIHDVVGTPI